jgi:lambda family phage portal protein
MLQANVIGDRGIELQARITDMDGRADTVRNRALEEAWKRWGERGNCEVTGKHTWQSLQALFIKTLAIDGELLIRRVIGGEVAEPFGFKLQLIDPELLDVDFQQILPNGNRIVMGVELDEWERPVAYHLKDQTIAGQTYSYVYAGSRRIRVPAEEINHVFLLEDVGQRRGLPWLGPALLGLKMLDGYFEAALINARIGASTMGFLTTESIEDFIGDADEDPEGGGDQISDMEPGIFKRLAAGEDIKPFDPQYPDGELPLFVKAMLRRLASGLNVSYHNLASDLESVNFSSSRAGTQEERDGFRVLQNFTAENLSSWAFGQWLLPALAMGQIVDIAGQPLDPASDQVLRRVRWQGRGWTYIQPEKDVRAKVEEIANGLDSYQNAIRERGRDPEQVWAELADDIATLEALGISRGESAEVDETDDRLNELEDEAAG